MRDQLHSARAGRGFFSGSPDEEFDIAELSFNSYILQTSRNESRYIGIPAFVSRCFRHSMIYVRTDRGLRKPGDLKGKLVGVPEYQLTALVWMRGIFEQQYGVKPSDIHWRSGGQEQSGRKERARIDLPQEIDLQPIPQGETLVSMLLAGKLDAVMTARAPSWFLKKDPNVDRMFPNHREWRRRITKRRPLPDHASDWHPQVACCSVSVAAGERLQGIRTGQGRGDVRPATLAGAQSDVAVGRSGDTRNHGPDG